MFQTYKYVQMTEIFPFVFSISHVFWLHGQGSCTKRASSKVWLFSCNGCLCCRFLYSLHEPCWCFLEEDSQNEEDIQNVLPSEPAGIARSATQKELQYLQISAFHSTLALLSWSSAPFAMQQLPLGSSAIRA